MGKLFALEEEKSSSDNDLIIDKLLDKKKQPSSPMSLTADLLKQRDQVNQEVKEHIEEQDEENEDNSDSSDDETSDKEEQSEDSDEADDDEPSDKKEESDDADEADDKDELKSVIGSGLSEKEDKEDKRNNEEVAEESLSGKTRLHSVFKPITLSHEQYLEQLAPYNLSLEAMAPESQPVVYVKEAIVESIARLTKVANSYIENIQSSVETYSDSLKKIHERVLVFTNLVEASKYHFTHKIVKDRDIITALSFKGHSDPRETSRALLKYINDSNKAVSLMVNNSFNDLRNAFTSKGFTVEGDDLSYEKPLPGFMLVKIGTVPYHNYLKTKLENYQYYAIKAFKVEDLYELPGISITEDKDIEYIVKTLNDLVVSTGVSIDTLKGITDHFNTFVNDLKVLSYDVQNDKYSNLAELGIDDNVQDFIKFKLAMEASLININMSMDYISSISSVLDICLELAE